MALRLVFRYSVLATKDSMLNHLKCEYMFVLERKQELSEKCWMSSVSEQDPFLRKEYLNFLKV